MKKKITLAVLLLSIALCARAQIYVGGNIGLSTSSGSDRIGIVIAPEIGYSFNQYLTVGTFLSYRSLQNTFGVTPYLRSNLCNVKDVFNFSYENFLNKDSETEGKSGCDNSNFFDLDK